MSLFLRKSSVLDQRIKDIRKELSDVDGRLKRLAKAARRAEQMGQTEPYVPADQEYIEQEPAEAPQQEVRPPEPEVRQPIVTTYPEQRAQVETAGRKLVADRDQITRDGRFATYLMSRDFHQVRPLRYERHVQRNKAIAMVIAVLLIFWWMIMTFF